MNTFDKIQQWYKENCDEDWDHPYGVEITTMDNPGWRVKIDLIDTVLHEKAFEKIDTYTLSKIHSQLIIKQPYIALRLLIYRGRRVGENAQLTIILGNGDDVALQVGGGGNYGFLSGAGVDDGCVEFHSIFFSDIHGLIYGGLGNGKFIGEFGVQREIPGDFQDKNGMEHSLDYFLNRTDKINDILIGFSPINGNQYVFIYHPPVLLKKGYSLSGSRFFSCFVWPHTGQWPPRWKLYR